MASHFSPKNKFLWDFWLLRDNGVYHAFYLQSRKTKDPEERHNAHVSIGHAVSQDLKHWHEQSTALQPGKKGSWDDLALWTGSVIKKGSTYYLFYTGRNSNRERMWVQKIGLAYSNDLLHWKKAKENPLLEADATYYATDAVKNKLGKIPAWRDPFVFKDPQTGAYFMTISARKKGIKKEYTGCIALARSHDLLRWDILPPILAPGRYDEMETSQVVYHNGNYYLFFSLGSTGDGLYEKKWKQKVGHHTGLHCYYSKNLFGGYKPVNKNGVVVEHGDVMYDIRLIKKNAQEYIALGWLNKNSDGTFLGKMSEPFGLVIDGDRVYKTSL